jgi:hypothetical protein
MAAPERLSDTIAERLRAEDTRAATLQALDALPPPCPPELALAAAPALVDVAAATEDREVLDQCGLLVARLLAEAAPDPSALYGAALGGQRLAAYFTSRLLVEAAHDRVSRDKRGVLGQPAPPGSKNPNESSDSFRPVLAVNNSRGQIEYLIAPELGPVEADPTPDEMRRARLRRFGLASLGAAREDWRGDLGV